MIESNEVRQGNYVMYDGRYFQIDVIASEFPTLNTPEFGIGVVDWNNIEPIPLSEDMFLSCGFKSTRQRISAANVVTFEKGGITYNAYTGYWDIFNSWTNSINIDCLHKLQNLFFALTGKELEVKL